MAAPELLGRQPLEGPVDRMFGMVGGRRARSSGGPIPVPQSRIFDVNGIRHIIRPQATAWASASNRDSRDLYPFDQYIEDINDFYGTSLALRNVGNQAWRARSVANRGLDEVRRRAQSVRATCRQQPLFWSYYGKLPIGRYYDSRPEDSIARNHVKTDYMYRISDSTAICRKQFDLNDGDWIC